MKSKSLKRRAKNCFILSRRIKPMQQSQHCFHYDIQSIIGFLPLKASDALHPSVSWAAWYNTWVLIKLVFSFLHPSVYLVCT